MIEISILHLNLIVLSQVTIVEKRTTTYQIRIQEDQEMQGQINNHLSMKMKTKVITNLDKIVLLMQMDPTQKMIRIR